MKKTNKKSNVMLANEWDNIASLRHQQIINNEDLSYNHVLIPSIFNLIKTELKTDGDVFILDAGCGTGNLSYQLSQYGNYDITGIDFSNESIEIAKKEYNNVENLRFINDSIEDHVKRIVPQKYNLIIANMTLMDVSNIDDVLNSISELLADNGKFVFSITHPVFWSKYWGYHDEEWFNYNEEIFIEANFKISLDNSDYITSHTHRPLEMYFEYLNKNNLRVINLVEPLPSIDIEKKYPKKWDYPRFMLIKCSS